MTAKPLRLLLVEDSETDAELLLLELRRCGYHVDFERVETERGLRAALAAREWDLLVTDYSLPEFDGLRTLRVLAESALDLPCIVVSATSNEAIAQDLLRAGAREFVPKGALARLGPVIERELRARRPAQG